MPTREAPQTISEQLVITQEREPENRPLVVPSPFVEKFKVLRRRTGDIRAQFLAGALLADGNTSPGKQIIERARALDEASTFLRNCDTEPLLHVSSRGLQAGHADQSSNDFRVYNWNAPEEGGAGLEIPVPISVSANCEGGRRNFTIRALFLQREPLRFPVPTHVLTEGNIGSVDVQELVQRDGLDAGVLAVGKYPVAQLFSAIREESLDVHRPGDWGVIPPTELNRAVAMTAITMSFE